MSVTVGRQHLHRYQPRGRCAELFGYRGGEVLISGPAGTGKSRACLEKLHLMALKNPGMRGLIVRKTLISLGTTALVTYEKQVAAEALDAEIVAWFGGSTREPAAYRYTNGSTIVVGGLDNPTKIMSSEYDVIYVQEAIELTIDDWEALTTRLRNGVVSFQQLMADTNPSTPIHWLKLRCDEGKTRELESRHEDNPRLFDLIDGVHVLTAEGRDYLERLDALTGPRHARLRRGLWVSSEGAVYEEYDPAVHLIDRFDIPNDWVRYWGIDFGFTNPFVCQWWAEDPDGRLYLYREIYHTKKTVDVHAADMLACVTDDSGEWIEPRPRAIICDHDAEGRAQLEKHLDMVTNAAEKAVIDGIQACQMRMRPAADGKPRLFILRDSLVRRDPELSDHKKPCCTAEELPGYIWDVGAGKAPKEVPLKKDDHGADTMRYIVADLDLIGRPGIRFM